MMDRSFSHKIFLIVQFKRTAIARSRAIADYGKQASDTLYVKKEKSMRVCFHFYSDSVFKQIYEITHFMVCIKFSHSFLYSEATIGKNFLTCFIVILSAGAALQNLFKVDHI